MNNLPTIESLLKENERLRKVNQVLMDRVEKGTTGSAYTLFEKNVFLDAQVKERTKELEKLTEAIQEEKNKLSGIIQTLPGAIVFFDKNYLVDFSFNSFLASHLDNVRGLLLEKVIGKDFADVVKASLKKISHNHEVVFFDFLGETSNSETYYNCSLSTRNLDQYVLYIQDNTARYQQERRIKQQEAQMLQSAKLASLGEMAAGIAHEINNPLTTIIGSATLLRKKLSKYKTADSAEISHLTKIEDTVMRISRIITAMRTISRDNEYFEKQEVPLEEIIHDVFALCSEKFKNNGVDLRLKISKKRLQDTLFCDRVQLSQVLINLLINAYDAIEGAEESWIELDFKEEAGFDVLMVRDSGPGIPSEIVPKIFNPFFTSKEVGKGTGLGLSIAKSILEKHGGSIRLADNSANTCFELRLPRS